MTTIKLQRTNEFSNRMRDYKIFIDGQQVGTIANGETKEFTTTVGQHIVTAKIDWCSSPDISVDVNENQTKILKVGGFKHGKWLMPVGIGLIAVHFILFYLALFAYAVFLTVPFFLLLFYYMTFGSKKYLILYELNDN